MDISTVFVIAITTARMIMPGMPMIPNMPGAGDFNAPTRTLTMNLDSGQKADAQSKAECAIPEGLKLGPKLNLTINLPQKSEAVDGIGTEENKESSKFEFKMKTYWSCSETVLEGQPKVIDSKDMNQSMREAMNNKNAQKGLSRAIETAEKGSHAYWPGEDDRKIPKDATCPGDYTLTTNYTGGTSIVFDKPQDFLAPIDIVSPGKKIDFEKFIKVEWKTVPNAVAYMLTATSGNGKEIITWTSSSDPNLSLDIQGTALSKAEVEKYIKNGVLLPADATYCCIPAGIFKDTKNAMLSVIAIGEDKSQTKDDIITHVIVRSNAMLMLGGMDMGGEEAEETSDNKDSKDKKEPAKEEAAANNSDNGDPVDQTNEALDKADKVKNTVNRAKKVLKW